MTKNTASDCVMAANTLGYRIKAKKYFITSTLVGKLTSRGEGFCSDKLF
jgi:hypothetical protein